MSLSIVELQYSLIQYSPTLSTKQPDRITGSNLFHPTTSILISDCYECRSLGAEIKVNGHDGFPTGMSILPSVEVDVDVDRLAVLFRFNF
jgi:hypothetical protein